MKNLHTIVATAVLVGGGVYYWLSQQAGPAAAGSIGGARAPGGFAGRQQAPPLVTVVPAARAALYDTVEAIGTASANESLTVTAMVTDTVSSVDFDEGE